ncbi:uncharacterized protein LOC117174200 [Belonocnema kinseyi]|uniref:uncharacterized protein LOC117174200 n=1 Tax=Belonocnema kinseyi TaxID=2817044 RepID=UPI00143DF551|nr:uncharacterized protein LOC117174200 [Belonocnema kinseyi]
MHTFKTNLIFFSPDGTLWQPSVHSIICSVHFVGNKKSEHPLSPSYNPTIFLEVYKKRPVNMKTAVERHRRHNNLELKRQKTSVEDAASQASSTTLKEILNVHQISEHETEQENNFMCEKSEEKTADKGVEANFL